MDGWLDGGGGGWLGKFPRGRCCRQVHLAKAVIPYWYIVAFKYLRVSVQGFPYRYSALTDFLGGQEVEK